MVRQSGNHSNGLSSVRMNLLLSAGEKASKRTGWLRRCVDWMLATSVTVILTGALQLLHANATISAIVYMVVVVLFATLAGQALSAYLAAVSAILFDYYFLAPLHSFAIYGFQNVLALAAFVGSCLVVGRVAERARRQTRQAERRREDVERLFILSQEMMLHDDAAGLIREIPRLVEHNFALDAVLLYVRDEDKLYSSIPGSGSGVEVADSNLTDQVPTEHLRDILRVASTAWESHSELAGGYFALNLVFGMKSVGTLAWKPAALSREVATSIAAQVAIAITRAHAIEASGRLEAARSADRLRAALIDSLTHELRTPLTAIRAAATTLVDGQGLDSETRLELATIVDEESYRLDSLIGEAMEIAEIESDGIRVQPEPVHVETFLEDVVQESQSILSSHHVSIDLKGLEQPVWFDPHLIGRVFRHLLENAASYTPSGSRIVLRCRRESGNIEFDVEDNGPGIDVKDLPLIFEKFYRGRQSGTTAKGSGMGLAITRALLTAHGGSITVESRPRHGSRFQIRIPLVERNASEGRKAISESAR
jgi:two-component system, OmpR family, sensor histidine kinase KdpD